MDALLKNTRACCINARAFGEGSLGGVEKSGEPKIDKASI